MRAVCVEVGKGGGGVQGGGERECVRESAYAVGEERVWSTPPQLPLRPPPPSPPGFLLSGRRSRQRGAGGATTLWNVRKHGRRDVCVRTAHVRAESVFFFFAPRFFFFLKGGGGDPQHPRERPWFSRRDYSIRSASATRARPLPSRLFLSPHPRMDLPFVYR